ncbi:unnamed protein product [Medioppia subpectinata]|uniref:Uncharacterized protein n=1 Tax=Medioppia subpectinata TaxID=1979941 RepID=A0A7R9Q6K3_9ACAR|nr:unnamed protein product [Medioppia subpectinata]CAG2113946.1 unnamed protein product [Medioppia subpectinata]
MTQTKSSKSCLKLLTIAFIAILSSVLPLVNSETDFIISEQIETCAENAKGSQLFKFTFGKAVQSSSIAVEDTSGTFELNTTNDNKATVSLKKPVDNSDNNFVLNITLDADKKIQIIGTFIKNCDNSYTSSCTVIIAFLASLCLILFTALALALIILRRKKPITFKFGGRDDRESIHDEHYEQPPKESTIDATNNILIGAKAVHNANSPRTSYPRKSSLKPSKSLTDQMNNNYDNTAFNISELGAVQELVEEVNEETQIEQKPRFQETRRKSIVTFSDTTQVKY